MRAFITLVAIINSSLAIKSRSSLDLDKQYQGTPLYQPEYHKNKMDKTQLKEYIDSETRN